MVGYSSRTRWTRSPVDCALAANPHCVQLTVTRYVWVFVLSSDFDYLPFFPRHLDPRSIHTMEVVGVVAGIVSACVAVSTEFRAWRKQKKERSSKKQNLELQKLLHGNGPAIQNEYDSDIRQWGETFKRGDGE